MAAGKKNQRRAGCATHNVMPPSLRFSDQNAHQGSHGASHRSWAPPLPPEHLEGAIGCWKTPMHAKAKLTQAEQVCDAWLVAGRAVQVHLAKGKVLQFQAKMHIKFGDFGFCLCSCAGPPRHIGNPALVQARWISNRQLCALASLRLLGMGDCRGQR